MGGTDQSQVEWGELRWEATQSKDKEDTWSNYGGSSSKENVCTEAGGRCQTVAHLEPCQGLEILYCHSGRLAVHGAQEGCEPAA